MAINLDLAERVVKKNRGTSTIFHGALVAAQVWNKPIAEAVAIANTVAGLSCRALDGQSGIPTKAELTAYLAGARS